MSQTRTPETDRHTVDADSNVPRPRRRLLKLIAAVVAAGAVVAWLAFWLYHRMTHVAENDARVATHEITVSSRLDGRVTDFDLIQGDRLAIDDRIAQLYSRPDELRRQQLAARVDRMQAQLDAQSTRIDIARRQIQGGTEQTRDHLKADIAAMHAARADMEKADHNAERSQSLYRQNGVSEEERDIDRYTYASARAEYERARRQVALDRISLANAKTGMLTTPSTTVANPDVLTNERAVMQRQLAEARAALAHQSNRIADLAVTAPLAGVVDQTFIEQGEYVAAGQPIVMMHDPDDVWIEARMKETKIADLAIGQPVAIHVDARPDTTYRGHVQVIGHAATNQFALLPDPNPSGNFTKITQRIPVRIAIDDGPRGLLAPGMMVEVSVDLTADDATIADNRQRHAEPEPAAESATVQRGHRLGRQNADGAAQPN
ncbi:HlyD family secretion protein [Salinisphaera sp. T31B1]|uniref:HlyD family secretion protein n=1 Tax=Salinisphaera sp. T31B1 TaxID=727963 RepID=UPI00333F0BF3